MPVQAYRLGRIFNRNRHATITTARSNRIDMDRLPKLDACTRTCRKDTFRAALVDSATYLISRRKINPTPFFSHQRTRSMQVQPCRRCVCALHTRDDGHLTASMRTCHRNWQRNGINHFALMTSMLLRRPGSMLTRIDFTHWPSRGPSDRACGACRDHRHGNGFRGLDAINTCRQDAARVAGTFACGKQPQRVEALAILTARHAHRR